MGDFRKENWIREGNTIRTAVVQDESGLLVDRHSLIAIVSIAADEDGYPLRAGQRIEIANLIAASPDLLNVAELVIEWIRDPDLYNAGGKDFVRAAEFALAKARGEDK